MKKPSSITRLNSLISKGSIASLIPNYLRSSNHKAVLKTLSRAAKLKKHPFDNKKILWFFWNDDIEQAPELIKISLNSWIKLNPDYQVIVLNSHNVKEITSFDFAEIFAASSVDLTWAGKTDILGLFLLRYYGGVWVDATTFCLKPLNQWLNDNMTKGFFCFRQPPEAIDRQLVSWFMAASSNNLFIRTLYLKAINYIFQRRPANLTIIGPAIPDPELYKGLVSRTETGFNYLAKREGEGVSPYFWMFYLLNDTCKEKGCKEIWQALNLAVNKYAQPHSPEPTFKSAYVSKQTYRDNIEEYSDRLNFLEQLY